jgi:hypothetical protein
VATERKIEEVQDLIKALEGVGKEMKVNLVIKNLVTDCVNGKDPREEYELQIKEENKKANAVNFQSALGERITSPIPEINIIIAMQKFREGSDYGPLARIIEIGANGSITNSMQTIGRVLRDYHQKEEAEVFNVLKGTFKSFNSEDEIKKNVEENLKHFFVSLMMENELSEIPLAVRKRLGFIKGLPWEDIIGREESLKIQEEAYKLFITKLANVGSEQNKWMVFKGVIKKVLTANGYTNKAIVKKCTSSIMMRWGIKALQMKGVNYDEITWDLIDKVDPRELIETYLSKSFEKGEIENIRRTTGFGRPNLTDVVLITHHLTSKLNREIDWRNPKSKEEIDFVEKYRKVKFSYEVMERKGLVS